MALKGAIQVQQLVNGKSKGNDMFKKIGSIIIFIACFVGVKYAFEIWLEKYRKNQAVTAVEEVFSEIEKEAENYDPEAPKSVALQEIAIKKAEENINSKSTPKKKKEAAISTFTGFYLVNYRTRREFCEGLGVGISTFTNEFKKTHRDELNIAKKIVFKNESDIDNLYKLIQPRLEKLIVQDMNDVASQYNVTTSEACQLVEENGVSFAETMHVSKIQPTVYRGIHN